MTAPRLLSIQLFGLAILVGILVLLGAQELKRIEAGHNGPDNSNLFDDSLSYGGYIARNVVLGSPIPVCSDDYPESTKAAVQAWNAQRALRSVFKLKSGANGEQQVFSLSDSECKRSHSHSRLGVDSVWVSKGIEECDSAGCIKFMTKLYPPDDQWDTYVGKPQIYVDRHTVLDPGGSYEIELELPDGNSQVTRTITHELGHVFGFANVKCKSTGTTPPSIFGPPFEARRQPAFLLLV